MRKCPICESQYNRLVTQRKNISPYQNKLFDTKEEACNVQRVNLNMYICETCGFVYNYDFDESILLYDKNYNNDQNASKVFEDYIEESMDYLIKNHIKDGNKILEIGCGRYGEYLKRIIKKTNNRCYGIGYDPAYIRQETLNDGHIKFINKFYNFNGDVDENIDMVISRHVIEHIKHPLDMFRNMNKIFSKNHNLKGFIETPDVTWILKNGVWYDFCYEHCSFFSYNSLKVALEKSGLQIKEFRNTFNDQYMQILVEDKNEINKDYDKKRIDELVNTAYNYNIQEKNRIDRYREFVSNISCKGKVAIWGAGAKGNIFLNMLDKKGQYISNVIDINCNKNGKFIAGTGHEIILPEKVEELGIKNILIMNSNYYNEIKKSLLEKNMHININLLEMDKI